MFCVNDAWKHFSSLFGLIIVFQMKKQPQADSPIVWLVLATRICRKVEFCGISYHMALAAAHNFFVKKAWEQAIPIHE